LSKIVKKFSKISQKFVQIFFKKLTLLLRLSGEEEEGEEEEDWWLLDQVSTSSHLVKMLVGLTSGIQNEF
jgi:hypothetical protein